MISCISSNRKNVLYILHTNNVQFKEREEKMYQNQNQVQNKPTAAYILSLIGGILGLLASLMISDRRSAQLA